MFLTGNVASDFLRSSILFVARFSSDQIWQTLQGKTALHMIRGVCNIPPNRLKLYFSPILTKFIKHRHRMNSQANKIFHHPNLCLHLAPRRISKDGTLRPDFLKKLTKGIISHDDKKMYDGTLRIYREWCTTNLIFC